MSTPQNTTDTTVLTDTDGMLSVAENLIQQGQFTEALYLYYGILYKSPDNGLALNGAGWLMMHVFEDIAKAEEYYKKALKANPDYGPAYLNYATLLNEKGDSSSLKKLLIKANKLEDIEKAGLFVQTAIMHEKLGEFDLAVEFFTKTLELSFDLEDVYALNDAIERCRVKTNVLKA